MSMEKHGVDKRSQKDEMEKKAWEKNVKAKTKSRDLLKKGRNNDGKKES